MMCSNDLQHAILRDLILVTVAAMAPTVMVGAAPTESDEGTVRCVAGATLQSAVGPEAMPVFGGVRMAMIAWDNHRGDDGDAFESHAGTVSRAHVGDSGNPTVVVGNNGRTIALQVIDEAGDNWLGDGSTVTLMSATSSGRGGCDRVIDLGIIQANKGLVVQGDTTGAPNSFSDCGITPPCDRYDDGISGPDQIYTITVDTTGVWSFDTCAGADFDSSIQIRRAVRGEGCPGDLCMGQDDDCCGGVCGPILFGTAHCRARHWMTLYVIVDGYSPSDFGQYTLSITYLGEACFEDVDEDGVVGLTDLLEVLSSWGPCPPPCSADIDGSGEVGFVDLLALLNGWGACP